ncbi:hypothetical protein RUND412_008493 [Rhizina undulata]
MAVEEGIPLRQARYGQLEQFEPPIEAPGVPKMLDSFRATSQTSQNYQQRKRDNSPVRRNSTAQQSRPEKPKSRRSSYSTSASLTVPASINGGKGNLAEFAAQITCLFWFESSSILQRVEESTITPTPQVPLVPDATPTTGFRKWVTSILATTQVSQNVIILALLFIYRLKKLNPSVKGKPGSEFRLFTVALMLGNKFLDDNTYTNKTWGDVSGISVQEIHVMEVEFLSNMRYSLCTSEEEWSEWHSKLARFWAYWDKASRTPLEVAPRAPAPITPILSIPPPPLPSPPPSVSSPPFVIALEPMAPFTHHYTHVNQPEIQPMTSNLRKRSYDHSNATGMQPPTKRVTRSMAPNISVTVPRFPSLAPPSSNVSTPPPILSSANSYPSATMSQPPMLHSSTTSTLPPTQLPLPGTRAMSTVYSQPLPQVSTPVSAGPASVNFNASPFSSTSRNTSPYSQQQSIHHSAASSPTTPGYSQQHSPVWFLGNRESPYRPARTVNTLLVPPMSFAEPQHLCYEQMHYQPLAKTRTEYRTGIVPYLPHEVAWPHFWSAQQPEFRV